MTDLLKEIEADSEAVPVLTDADLTLVSSLAQRQVDLLGPGIAKGPTGDAIQGLRDWSKRNNITAAPELKDFSASVLIGALVERLNEFRDISEVKLPAAMQALGLTEFKLANGYSVGIDEDVRVSVRAEQWDGAAAWLKENGLGDIVKDEVKMNFNLDDTGLNIETPIGRELLQLAVKHQIIQLTADGEQMLVYNKELQESVPAPVSLSRADAILALAKEEGIVGEEKMSINAATLKATVKEQRRQGVVFPEEYFSLQDFKKALVVPPKAPKAKKAKAE